MQKIAFCCHCFNEYKQELGCPCQGGTGGNEEAIARREFQRFQEAVADRESRTVYIDGHSIVIPPGMTMTVRRVPLWRRIFG